MKNLSRWTALAALCGLALGLAGLESLTAADQPKPSRVSAKVKDQEQIDFTIDDKLVASYHCGKTVAKPFMWPVHSPNGVGLTRDWPMKKATPEEKGDHKHQKSLWFCHGDVIPEGIELKVKGKNVKGVDFWAEEAGHGKIVCTRVGEPKFGEPSVRVETQNDWVTADGVKIMEETRTISLQPLGGAYLFVFDIDLFASVCPITFGDTKEGSFGVRVNELLNEAKGKGVLATADGKVGEKNGIWGSTSEWCDYSGTVDGKKAGITILCSPNNPVPSYWHSRAYGLMAANPFGRKEEAKFPAAQEGAPLVKLKKGEHLKLRYGVLLHDGDVKDAKVADLYAQFAKMK